MLDFAHLPGYRLFDFRSTCPRHLLLQLERVVRLQRKKPEGGGRSASPYPLSWWPLLLCLRSTLFLHILTRAVFLSERAVAVRDEVFSGKDFSPKSAQLKCFWHSLVETGCSQVCALSWLLVLCCSNHQGQSFHATQEFPWRTAYTTLGGKLAS